MNQSCSGQDARSERTTRGSVRGLRWFCATALVAAAAYQFGPLGRSAFGFEGGKPHTAVRVSSDDIATLDRVSTAIHRVAETVKPSVVSIQTMNARPSRRLSTSAGSGVIFDERGYIVTSHHVVADADRVDVTLFNRRTYRADVV